MRYLPDINVWLALSLPQHAHHSAAMLWFEEDPHLSAYFCRATQHGLLRLLTTAAVTVPFGRSPLSNREAWASFEAVDLDERIRFADEPERITLPWREYSDVRTSSPKLWMDAYLAAFSIAGGYRLVTTDKAFKQFKGLDMLLLK